MENKFSDDYKYKNWVFTWNANEEGDLVSEEKLHQYLKTQTSLFIFQKERGLVEGRLHYQGAFQTLIRKRQPTLLNAFENEFGGPLVTFLTIDRMQGTWDQSVDYCSKSESRVGGLYCSPSLIKYTGKDVAFLMEKENMFPWQKTIMDTLVDESTRDIKAADDRSIMWVYDPCGNSGKSKFVKFLCFCYDSVIKIPFGSAAQMRSATAQTSPRKLYVVDIPRTLGEDDSLLSLISVLEDIKNGHVTSSFYGKLTTSIFSPPHVLIFANFRCPIQLMSGDRWKQYAIIQETKELITDSNYICYENYRNIVQNGTSLRTRPDTPGSHKRAVYFTE